MPRVLVLGAGKIGSLVACLLSQQGTYDVHLGDITLDAPKHLVEDLALPRVTPAVLDVQAPETVATYLSAHPVDAIISSLPYFCNPGVAALALKHDCHYFDLTEDVEVTDQIRAMSKSASRAFMPQCGLAPGFISIVTHELMTHFETLAGAKSFEAAFELQTSYVKSAYENFVSETTKLGEMYADLAKSTSARCRSIPATPSNTR